MLCRFLLSLFAGALCCSTQAAEIRTGSLNHRAEMFSIVISGEIVSGDTERLSLLLKDTPLQLYNQITLSGPGGNVDEAIKMAELLRPRYFQITVPKNKTCASACFIVWLAGAPRRGDSIASVKSKQKILKQHGLDYGGLTFGLVGVHRPYFARPNSPSRGQVNLMSGLAKYFDNQMVPRRITDLMMSRASNDIYWLEDRDFEEIGEYSPEVEEFLISKCDYVAFKNHHANDPERMRKIIDLKISECVSGVLAGLRNKTIEKKSTN